MICDMKTAKVDTITTAVHRGETVFRLSLRKTDQTEGASREAHPFNLFLYPRHQYHGVAVLMASVIASPTSAMSARR